MENRRQYFRLAMDATQRLMAQFQGPEAGRSFSAEIVNLSIGGMCVVPDSAATTAGRWQAVFTLEDRKMQMTVDRVYSDGERPGHCGFRFVPAADNTRRDEQERAIWKFLLEKQRQERRQNRAVERKTG